MEFIFYNDSIIRYDNYDIVRWQVMHETTAFKLGWWGGGPCDYSHPSPNWT